VIEKLPAWLAENRSTGFEMTLILSRLLKGQSIDDRDRKAAALLIQRWDNLWKEDAPAPGGAP
jgi:hypothetical protein